ncbi:hypothetical protein GGI05_001808 [Coemansia sp. RSA 2603]|nr:hypothetical protein GGI05_001808 [Coemansia sp. RSA 2603]
MFPKPCYSTKARVTASSHYLSTLIHHKLSKLKPGSQTNGGWKSAKGGTIAIDAPGQEVIERTSVIIDEAAVEARLTMCLPAAGRTILGHTLRKMLFETLPWLVKQTLFYDSVNGSALNALLECVEDQEYLRAQLDCQNLLAFIADGSILPRISGVSSLPLPASSAVKFRSPDTLRVSFTLPNRGVVTGMGVRHGITLICGGGFNGKSTLLQAIEMGVYNHVPGDGRELVVTVNSAAKIKAEEGRYVSNVDIRPFINHLPFGKDTSRFSTSNASGSTSMAASIQEALEAKTTAFLFDEDTCATNFLVRDGRMQRLVSQKREPITPLISRIRELWDTKHVSSVLVIGGCGDYLDVADTVIDMCEYTPSDATSTAKNIAAQLPISIESAPTKYGSSPCRTVKLSERLGSNTKAPKVYTKQSISLFPSTNKSETPSSDVLDDDSVSDLLKMGSYTSSESVLDLSALDQLVSASQTRSIARIIHQIARSHGKTKTMSEWLELVDSQTLDELDNELEITGDLARPRKIEVALAINRLRLACMG